MGLGQKIPLSVDWLALSLRLKTPVCNAPNGHSWCHYTPTNVWYSRWVLFNEYGEKVFTLLFQPRSGVIKPDAALFEVANEWLYHGIGINGALELLRCCCDYEILGISRFDLAADFNPTTRQYGVIKRLARGDCYVQGKQSRTPWYTTRKYDYEPEMLAGEIPYNQSWGHKTSDVKWKLYYKTKELKDEAKGIGWSKPYIVDMWREYGLQENNVWRLEVSIHSANNFNFMGEKLSFEKFMHSGSDLFQSLYTSRFSIRANQGHKDRSNDNLIPFLPVGRLAGAFKVRRRDCEVEHNGSLTLLRHLINDILQEQVLINEPVREQLLQTIEVIIERDGLHRYFRSIVGDEFDSWAEWVRVQAYYFGVENLEGKIEDDTQLEMAMLDAGLIHDHTQPLSVLNPNKSQYVQQKIQFKND